MTTEDYKENYSHGNASASALPEPPEEIRGNDKAVFISYSTKNPEAAAFVCEWLEFNGMRCWVAPRDLLPGTNFADNIEIALGNAKMLVLVLSKQSAASPWVEGEINTAFSAGKPILVFQIDNVELTGSLKMMLSKFPTIRLGKNNSDACGAELVTHAQKSLESVKISVHKIAGIKKLRTLQNLADEASKTSVPAGTIAAAPDEISDDDKNVFISYSTKNPEAAAFVCEWLEWAGIRCWIAPRDLISGTNFADNIEIALGNAKMLVLILSKDSANSPWVESEINVVFSAGKPILIYQIDDAEPEGSMKVMLGKFLTIRRGNVEENDGNALIESTLRLLAGEKIFVEKRAGTRKKHGKKHDSTEKFETQKCLILAAPQDMRIAQKLKNEVFRADAFAQIMDVAKLPWVREDKIPESYRRRFEESMIVVVVLSPSLEAVPAAQALIKFAFSIKKSILPYKIYVGKPSAGMSLLLGMAHWLDVSMLPNAEAGIREFRKALKVHLARTKSFRGVYMRWFLRIAGMLILALLALFVALNFDWNRFVAPANSGNVENVVPAKNPQVEQGENGVPAKTEETRGSGDILVADAPTETDEPTQTAENLGNDATPVADSKTNETIDSQTGDKSVAVPESENSVPAPKFLESKKFGEFEIVFISAVLSDSDGKPQRFGIGKTEVTQGQWKKIMGTNPSTFQGNINLPVEHISWTEAMEFCEKLIKRERRANRLPKGYKYTLPTSEQWEIACRAGTKTRFCSGDDESDLEKVAWYDGNSKEKTHHVKTKKPNAWGIYDMHGNVWEWCLDARGTNRVIRGGSWIHKAETCASSFESKSVPSSFSHFKGFRVALVPEKLTGTQNLLANENFVSEKKNVTNSNTNESEGNSPSNKKNPSLGFVGKEKFGDFEIVFISAILSNSDGKPQKFGIGKTEVTQAQWEKIMKTNPSHFIGKNLPVENVSWNEAMEFCRKLTLHEELAGRLPRGYKYMLPTSEQWEIACRAGTTTSFCSGDSEFNLRKVAWWSGNSRNKTHPVGQKIPNAWGIHDVHGNVREWCLDESINYNGKHINRGGSWVNDANDCESSSIYNNSPDYSNEDLGFRVALVPKK